MKLAPYDDLNVLRVRVESVGQSEMTPKQKRREINDLLTDLLEYAYLYGVDDLNEMIGTELLPSGKHMTDTIYKVVAGKDVTERVNGYVDDSGTVSIDEIIRLAESEMTRDYNDSLVENAKMTGIGLKKSWETMRDGRVRPTHEPLQGVTIGLDEKFVAPDGDTAMGPGGFEKAENNAGCRCHLRISRL